MKILFLCKTDGIRICFRVMLYRFVADHDTAASACTHTDTKRGTKLTWAVEEQQTLAAWFRDICHMASLRLTWAAEEQQTLAAWFRGICHMASYTLKPTHPNVLQSHNKS